MMYEYALDPRLLADINNCRTIFDNFKPEQGKVISDVPRQWIREAYREIQTIEGPVLRKTLKLHLKKLLDKSLCDGRYQFTWDRYNESWAGYVARVNQSYPFSAVISESSSVDPLDTYSLSDLFHTAPACWNAPTQIMVKRSASDIVDALMPLLCISRHIILIDRHIYPGNTRSLRVLRELIKRSDLFNFGRGIKKIQIHSSNHRMDYQQSLEQHLLPHLPSDFEVSASLWPKAVEHDRFLVTEVGGIDLGEGFNEQNKQDTDEVKLSLVSHDIRKRLISKFSGNPTYRAYVKG